MEAATAGEVADGTDTEEDPSSAPDIKHKLTLVKTYFLFLYEHA